MFPRARLGFLTPRPRYHYLHAKPCQRRTLYSTTSNVTSTSRPRRSGARIAAITAGTALFLTTSTVYASSSADEAELAARPALSSLVRAYAVYSMCSIPALVDAAPTMLAALSSVPGIKQITEAFVRVTFFNQVRPQ
jgi:proline dehydrogenase